MSAQALQITARGPRSQAEAAARAMDEDPALEAATYSILEEDEQRGVWRIDAYPVSDAEAAAMRGAFAAFSGLAVAVEALADADWLAMSLSGLPPVRAGRFFVFGAHDAAGAPPNAIKLRIEAGAAFGTGHHGTTVGCLWALDALLKQRRFPRALDVGVGTGVLAIAAAKTGSRRVIGTDIDAASVRIARENAGLNGAQARFLVAGDLKRAAIQSGGPYELIFANILARPLTGLAADITGALAPGGRVILSGLLRGQERFVRAAYLARGLRLERRIHRDAWATLVMAQGA